MTIAGLSLAVVLVMFFVVPVTIAVFLGFVASRGETPNVYRCGRCGAEFRRHARRFPATCPGCGAADWAAPPGPR